jgi:hypothetical protein
VAVAAASHRRYGSAAKKLRNEGLMIYVNLRPPDRVVTYEGFLVPTGSGTRISVPTGPNFDPRDARGPREFRRNILWDGPTTVPAGVGST